MTIEQLNAYISLPAIILGFIYIGRKLQVLDSLQESVARLESTMEKVKHNLKVIGDYLTRNHPDFDPRDLQVLSPLELTESGREFIHGFGFEKIFAQNKLDFFRCIDDEEPKFKYDVETAAIRSIYAMNDKPYMDFLKIFFYANPKRNFQNTAPTLGVYIRDAYLKEHPEIFQ